MADRTITPREFAKALDISHTTAYKMIHANRVEVVPNSKPFRIPASEVERFEKFNRIRVRRRELPPEDELAKLADELED